jgi:DNA polymerase-3 subunit beta
MLKTVNKNLAEGVSFVSGIVAKSKNTSPVFANIKILVDQDGSLVLETCNNDLSCIYRVDAKFIKSTKQFTTTVPAYKLLDILKKLQSDSDVSCKFVKTSKSEVLAIVAAGSKFLLNCTPANLFPSYKSVDFASRFDVDVDGLLAAIDQVKFSVCNDESRFYINGVLIHSGIIDGKNYLNVVSTDSHRLSISRFKIPDDMIVPKSIIPKRAIQKVLDILSLLRGKKVSILLSKTKIRFESEMYSVSSNLIDGEFPQYEKVVPSDVSKTAKVKTANLIKALERTVTIYSGTNINVVKMIFTHNKLTIVASKDKISTAGSDAKGGDGIGIAKTELQCETNFDSEFVTCYNYSYILEILANVGGDDCVFYFSESNRPCLIKPDKAEAEKSLFVAMPIRI